eukprot:Skav203567  [mRNA]  locus=scaffold3576:205842:217986:+ [translate_table: standard]
MGLNVSATIRDSAGLVSLLRQRYETSLEEDRALRQWRSGASSEELDDFKGERFNTEETALPVEGDDLIDLDDDLRNVLVSAHLEGVRGLLGVGAGHGCEEISRLLSADPLTSLLLEQLTGPLIGHRDSKLQRAAGVVCLVPRGECAWRHLPLRRKSGELVDVVAMIRHADVAGIYLFMCLEVHFGGTWAGPDPGV